MDLLKRTVLYLFVFSQFSSLFSQDQNHVDSLIAVSNKQIIQNQYFNAINNISRCLQYEPENINFLLKRAYANLQVKKHDAAMDDIYMILIINNNNADAHFIKGNINKSKQNYELAIQDFNKVLEIKPNYLEAINQIVDIYLLQNKYQKAYDIIENAIHKNLTYGDFYFYKAKVLQALDNYEDAVSSFENALLFKEEMDSGLYYLNTGNTKLQLYKLMDAKDDYNKAIHYNPHEAKAYYARGIVWYELGNFDQAMNDFNRSINLIKIEKDTEDEWENELRKRYKLIADTIEYDVVVKNPNKHDKYTEDCLDNLKKNKFLNRIVNAVIEGKITPYDFNTKKPIPPEEIEKIKAEIDINKIGMIKFNEEWYFDPNEFSMGKKVNSIVLGYEVTNAWGEVRGYKPYFMVYLNKYNE
jgi:tetratricopeptide (TPR) repeat protein